MSRLIKKEKIKEIEKTTADIKPRKMTIESYINKDGNRIFKRIYND